MKKCFRFHLRVVKLEREQDLKINNNLNHLLPPYVWLIEGSIHAPVIDRQDFFPEPIKEEMLWLLWKISRVHSKILIVP